MLLSCHCFYCHDYPQLPSLAIPVFATSISPTSPHTASDTVVARQRDENNVTADHDGVTVPLTVNLNPRPLSWGKENYWHDGVVEGVEAHHSTTAGAAVGGYTEQQKPKSTRKILQPQRKKQQHAVPVVVPLAFQIGYSLENEEQRQSHNHRTAAKVHYYVIEKM